MIFGDFSNPSPGISNRMRESYNKIREQLCYYFFPGEPCEINDVNPFEAFLGKRGTDNLYLKM